MTVVLIGDGIQDACRVHARLLDAFIEMTRQEIDKVPAGFAQESLREYLEMLRDDRKAYGTLAVPVPVESAA